MKSAEDVAERAIKREYNPLRTEVAEKIAMFVTRPDPLVVWRMARKDLASMLDGWEPHLWETHYEGWSADEVQALMGAVNRLLNYEPQRMGW